MNKHNIMYIFNVKLTLIFYYATKHLFNIELISIKNR